MCHVEIIRHVAADGILYGRRGKTTSCHLTLEYFPRDKFWDLVSGCLILCLEMLETSALGLGQDLGLTTALGGAMTTSTYVSRIVFDLIPSRFKVHDMFSAYRCYPCVGCTRAISTRWLSLFRTLRVCCDQQQTYRYILPFLSLREEYVFEKMFGMYDCLVFQEGAFIEEGDFVKKWFFRRLRRLSMLKIDFFLFYAVFRA
ncbi:hypothetical protein YC2023_098846 [Brassica napus]